MFRPRRGVAAASVAGASVVGVLLLLVAPSVVPGVGSVGRPAVMAAQAEASEETGAALAGAPLTGLDSLFPAGRDSPAGSRPGACPDRGQLVDHGGPVQTRPRLYVDFWGWTSDPDGERPTLVDFLSSIGDGRWLSTLSQYCAGDDPSLTGQWSDTADRPPRHPSDAEIQAEGRAAAGHFGVTTPSASDDQNVQIIVALPPGVPLPAADSQDCAYHQPLSQVRAPAGLLPVLTVLPYLPGGSFGRQCGAFSVNTGPAGALDALTITEGHELAEAITDPEADGWFDQEDPPEELADKCQANQDYDIGADGHTFAVQQLWSNATNGCVVMAAPPGAPTEVKAVGVDTHIDVSWSPPAQDGGTPVTAWTVTASPGSSSCTESGHTSCALPGLVNGTTYSVVVRAVNAAGAGAGSARVAATPTSDQNCTFLGPSADLQHCRLTSAVITGSDLTGADLAGADLAGATVRGADLRDADLAGADLDGATLTGSDLFGADLSGSTLGGATLADCTLSAVDITDADLSGLRMQGDSSSGITGAPRRLPLDWSLVGGYLIGPGADLDEADLSFADLMGADLTGADLSHADLISADVSHADLSDADLRGADMSDADLRGADVSDTDLGDLAGVIPFEFLCPGGMYGHGDGYACDNGL